MAYTIKVVVLVFGFAAGGEASKGTCELQGADDASLLLLHGKRRPLPQFWH